MVPKYLISQTILSFGKLQYRRLIHTTPLFLSKDSTSLTRLVQIGHGVSLSLLRENTTGHYEEIIPIDKNLKYDFNFQQATYLKEEVTVLPVSFACMNLRHSGINDYFISE